MIASVTEQQAASVNSGGSGSISAGGMNNENDVPKNLNGSSNNQSFGQSNGMRNGDSFEFEKFKVCTLSFQSFFNDEQLSFFFCRISILQIGSYRHVRPNWWNGYAVKKTF